MQSLHVWEFAKSELIIDVSINTSVSLPEGSSFEPGVASCVADVLVVTAC